MFVYPKEEIDGDWFDLVWDLSSYTAIKAMTVRFDVRMDAGQNWINGTPARDFFMDEVTLDANPDQREFISAIGDVPLAKSDLVAYSVNRTVFFSMPDASRASLYDLSGKEIVTRMLDDNTALNAIQVPRNGIYILKVGTRNGKVTSAKIYVE
jgi:hypothetical protein